uniref:diacylglycerol O-acyltransferase n=2 Tax=Haematococcus lacustris TaxID=44745 RepID=A0A872ZLT6_HAELA|nr:DGAT1 [Haematococcus lacustris]WNL52999.1 DGTT1 [synthetic construct]
MRIMPWPFRRKPLSTATNSDGESEACKQLEDAVKERTSLQREVLRLQAQNAQLQEQLAARDVVVGESLYRWRSVALPLLGSEWEQRYFLLQGTSLMYYKSDKDVAFSPREEFSTLGCSVEWQGLVNRRWWAFALLDPAGNTACRMASLNKEVALKWVAALQAVGCERRDTSGPRGISAIQAARHLRPSASLPARPFSSLDLGSTLTPGYSIAYQPVMTAAAEEALPAQAHSSSPSPGPRPSNRQALALSGADDPHGPAPPQTPQTLSTSHVPTASPAEHPAEVLTSSTAPGASPSSHTFKPATAHAAPSHASLHGGPGGHTVGHSSHAGGKGPMSGSTPVHTGVKLSYLSSERMWHEKHTGLFNLMGVILVATNFRLALENALKYGWRYNPLAFFGSITIGNPNIPLVLCYPAMCLMVALALMVEKLGAAMVAAEHKAVAGWAKREEDAAPPSQAGGGPQGLTQQQQQQLQRRRKLARQSARGEWVLFWLNAANTTAAVALPWAVIFTTKAEPLSAAVLICLAVVLWMKLVSFHHCCADLRQARRQGEVRPGERGSPGSPAEWALLAYPENLTLSHLAYFLAAPTLSYQVNYPRTGTIRKKWLARRVGELVVMLTVLSLIVAQYVQPAVANSMGPLMQMDWLHIVERVLKLALPNMYCWLVMFYCVFHLWLNILAELLRFGDREFYKDWWNSSDVGSYWKQWNLPVHKWLLRHVYFPALRLGLSRWPAMILVFFVSAVFHELVLGVPLHMVRLWAFSGIMLQVPLVILTDYARKKLNRDEAGNIVFWLSFCVVGQPLTLLLYSHDYLYEVKPHLMATQAANTSSGIVI